MRRVGGASRHDTGSPRSKAGSAGRCQTYRGVLARLATVQNDELRELLIDAWRMVAPKRLVRELDAE